MRTLITVAMCLFFSLSYSQEKNVDLNAMQAKLASVQADIVVLEERIETIQGRLEGVPEAEISEEKQNVIADLNARLEMLRRVEFSTSEFLKDKNLKKIKKTSNEIH